MYIGKTYEYYDSDGQQHVRKADFLILYGDTYADVRACIRRVALSQFGHWMTGRANVYGQWVSLSGAYGHDGLICNTDKLPEGAFDSLVRLPSDLSEKMGKDNTGWNSAGVSGHNVRQWALANLDALRLAGRKTKPRKNR